MNAEFLILTVIPFIVLLGTGFFDSVLKPYKLLSNPSTEFNSGFSLMVIVIVGAVCDVILLIKTIVALNCDWVKLMLINFSPNAFDIYSAVVQMSILVLILLFAFIAVCYWSHNEAYKTIKSNIETTLPLASNTINHLDFRIITYHSVAFYCLNIYLMTELNNSIDKTLLFSIAICYSFIYAVVLGIRERISALTSIKITRTILVDSCGISLPEGSKHTGYITKEIVKTEGIKDSSTTPLSESVLFSCNPYIDGFLVHSDNDKHIVIVDGYEVAINRHWILYQYELN